MGVIDPGLILRRNKQVLESNACASEGVILGLAETMPQMLRAYDLEKDSGETNLSNGFPIKRAIQIARAVKSPKCFEKDNISIALDRKLKDYLDFIRMQSFCYDPKALFDSFPLDVRHMQDLTGLVREFSFRFVESFQDSQKSLDPKYSGAVPEALLRLIAQAGRVPLAGNGLKRLNLNFLSKVLYPSPEYGFATDEDSWNLFRDNFMGQPSMHFGLVRSGKNGFELYVVDHRKTNGLGKMANLNKSLESPTYVGRTLEEALSRYEDLTGEGNQLFRVSVYGLPDREYNSRRSRWYYDILRRFGNISTITSMHRDESLFLTRQTLPIESEFRYQNITHTNVNGQLRKLITLSRLLGGNERSLAEAYPSIGSVIRNYQKQVFEMNLGVLISDVSHASDARGWLGIPTYLTPGRYPSIGVTKPFFDFNGQNFDVSISVRTNNDLAQRTVERSIYDTFGNVRKVYPA